MTQSPHVVAIGVSEQLVLLLEDIGRLEAGCNALLCCKAYDLVISLLEQIAMVDCWYLLQQVW